MLFRGNFHAIVKFKLSCISQLSCISYIIFVNFLEYYNGHYSKSPWNR